MVTGVWGRLAGGASVSTLEVELKRATNAKSIDAPKDALLAVVQSTNNEDDRRTIMRHLHGCLAESASSRWRRVYLGLLVVEELLRSGNPILVTETAEGMHFDLVQRMTFLGNFEFGCDKRVEGMVRRKADVLRAAWLERQLALDGGGDGFSAAGGGKSAPAAPATTSTNGGVGKKPATTHVAQPQHKAKSGKSFGLGGLVSVGHNEDTTDESSDEDSALKSRRGLGSEGFGSSSGGGGFGSYGGGREGHSAHQASCWNGAGNKAYEDQSTTDDTESGSSTSSPPQPAAESRGPPQPTAGASSGGGGGGGGTDLLGGLDEPSPATSRAPPAASADLLGDSAPFSQQHLPPHQAAVPATAATDLGDLFVDNPAVAAPAERPGQPAAAAAMDALDMGSLDLI